MNTAYMRNKRRQTLRWKKHLLLADMGIAMALEHSSVSQTLQMSACSSLCLSLFLWDALSPWSGAGGGTQPCAFGTWHLQDMASALMPRSPCTSLATAGKHSPSNASARGHLRSPPAKSGEAPTGGTYPDVPSPEDSVVAPSSGDLLFIFPLSFANFLLPKCCQKEVNHPKHWEHSHDICS